jgi:DNA-binding CsgD family transcriptional regulator
MERSAHDVFRQDVPCVTDGCGELTDPEHSLCAECRKGNSPAQRAVAYRQIGDIPRPGEREKRPVRVAAVAARPTSVSDVLTGREVDVLAAIADGDEIADIASRLSLSKWTVISHRKSALRKLGAKSSPNAIAIAFRRGILSVES